jgi:selenocysteine lyase/cysteine desulfurase
LSIIPLKGTPVMPLPQKSYSTMFSKVDVEVPLLDGSTRRYINLDNAASTPPLDLVQQVIDQFMVYYSSVHRGTGFKSQLATHAYEDARLAVLRFVGGDSNYNTCVFGKNTTEALNKLARRFPFSPRRDIVLSSGMEHHSNDLPWRAVARVIHVRLTPEGELDEEDFDRNLHRYGEQIALVAVTAASNVTGFLNPIHRLAKKAHAVGAQIVVDCAQLAPHRKINMLSFDDPGHLDYVSLSAHKLYAPYGTGALIGPRATFEQGEPDMTGGGTVEIVTLNDVVWSGPPDREEAGSPNTVGAIALAASLHILQEIGMENIAAHEAELTAYTLRRISRVPGLEPFGDPNPEHASKRLGVIPFRLDGLSHFLVSAILGYEFGIGVRSGCFCAHPYILHLLGLSPSEARAVRSRMLAGDKSDMPGLVRISFGLYNTLDEIDTLIEALNRIARGEYSGQYIQEKSLGEYHPVGWDPDFEEYFSFNLKAAL